MMIVDQDSWHMRLCTAVYQDDYQPGDLCRHFWRTVGAVVIPLTIVAIIGLWFGWMASEKSQEKQYLIVLGLVMTGTYVGMVLTGNILALMIISFVNGIAWAFLRPREEATSG